MEGTLVGKVLGLGYSSQVFCLQYQYLYLIHLIHLILLPLTRFSSYTSTWTLKALKHHKPSIPPSLSPTPTPTSSLA